MTTLTNSISIRAPIGKIWSILTDLEVLAVYDPTLLSSHCVSDTRKGIGARRKVVMKDGKNWFEEKVTEYEELQALTYTLTDCSFPIKSLRHRYTFREEKGTTLVTQSMEYQVKFGFLGNILDYLMIRKQSDAGIKKFFSGLKDYAEKSSEGKKI